MTEQNHGNPTIRTPDQRLRVFISSTLAELADERAAVAEAINALRLTPVLFELGARPHPPRELYRAYLAQSDVFVGLYWQRYGWIGPDMEISGLEDEFQLSDSLPRLLYVKAPAPDREPRLAAMIEQLQSDGSESYRRFTTTDELGRLVRDDLALLLTERFLSPAASPEPSDTPRRQAPLPVAPTSLLGREDDIDEAEKLLASPDVRLVTLTGPGGIGKTRLAVAVAERLQARYGYGATFVPLASITEPALVLPHIAGAVGATVEGVWPAIDAIGEHLGDESMLLVLDNLEQVADAASELNLLISRCRGLDILATSRAVLRLRVEHEYSVEPLEVPRPGENTATEHLASTPAVELFVDRAQAARRSFELTARNAPAIAEICRRLDGLPLAIELAAARVRLLEPDELLPRLERGLDALGSGPVDLPARQRTLRATVEWSIGLLDDHTRETLAKLAVFIDGWTIEAARHVAGVTDDEVLDVLDVLTGHSLVMVEATDVGPRFRMLESVRALATEHLESRPDRADVERRHAEYFRDLVVGTGWPRQGQADWTEMLRLDEGNIRRTVRWHFAHELDPLPRMFRILWLEWQMLDLMPEGRGWLEELVQRADSLDVSSRAELYLMAGVTAGEVGEDAEAVALGQRLQELAGHIDDPYLESASLLATAWISAIGDDFDHALASAYRALDGFRQQDELGVTGFAPFITPSALLTVGMLEMSMGRLDTARSHLVEVAAHGDQFSNTFLSSGARSQLAWLSVMAGELEEARAQLRDAVDVANDMELSTHPLSFSLVSFARLSFAEGNAASAALALGAAAGVRERAGLRAWASTRRTEAELLVQVTEALGAERFDEVFADGSQLGRREAIALVRGTS